MHRTDDRRSCGVRRHPGDDAIASEDLREVRRRFEVESSATSGTSSRSSGFATAVGVTRE